MNMYDAYRRAYTSQENRNMYGAHNRSSEYQRRYSLMTPNEKAALDKQKYNMAIASGNNISGLVASAKALSPRVNQATKKNIRNAVKIRWNPKTRKASRKASRKQNGGNNNVNCLAKSSLYKRAGEPYSSFKGAYPQCGNAAYQWTMGGRKSRKANRKNRKANRKSRRN